LLGLRSAGWGGGSTGRFLGFGGDFLALYVALTPLTFNGFVILFAHINRVGLQFLI
jgi:hypothetical protein